jgi:hypothetical protein
MTFSAKSVYRHMSCTDMELLVLHVAHSCPDYVKLKVLYLSQQYGHVLHDADTVKINSEDFWKWQLVK